MAGTDDLLPGGASGNQPDPQPPDNGEDSAAPAEPTLDRSLIGRWGRRLGETEKKVDALGTQIGEILDEVRQLRSPREAPADDYDLYGEPPEQAAPRLTQDDVRRIVGEVMGSHDASRQRAQHDQAQFDRLMGDQFPDIAGLKEDYFRHALFVEADQQALAALLDEGGRPDELTMPQRVKRFGDKCRELLAQKDKEATERAQKSRPPRPPATQPGSTPGSFRPQPPPAPGEGTGEEDPLAQMAREHHERQLQASLGAPGGRPTAAERERMRR